eukprot:578452-Prymnesium_polylepis.1
MARRSMWVKLLPSGAPALACCVARHSAGGSSCGSWFHDLVLALTSSSVYRLTCVPIGGWTQVSRRKRREVRCLNPCAEPST